MRVPFRRLRDWWPSPRGDEHLLERTEDETLRAMRHDVDAEMSDLLLITNAAAGSEALLPMRLELMSLDVAVISNDAPERYATMQKNCDDCPHWRRCARELVSSEASIGLATYCRNAELIDQVVNEAGPVQSGRETPE